MNKTVLIIHGWPQPLYTNHILYSYFKQKQYILLTPYLFSIKDSFTIKKIITHIEKSLHGVTPDIIIGISMGGLIAPYLAKKYPKSKLIFIASGTKFLPKSKLARIGILVLKMNFGLYLLRLIDKIPKNSLWKIFNFIYQTVNFPTDYTITKTEIQNQAVESFNDFKQIDPLKNWEIIHFLLQTDTSFICSELNNRTMIFSGSYDQLMPIEEGKLLHRIIPTSNFHLSKNGHGSVFTQKECQYLDSFISS